VLRITPLQVDISNQIQSLGHGSGIRLGPSSLDLEGFAKVLERVVEFATLLMDLSDVLDRKNKIAVVLSERDAFDAQSFTVELHRFVVGSSFKVDGGNVIQQNGDISVVGAEQHSSYAQTFHETLHCHVVQLHLEEDKTDRISVGTKKERSES